MSGTESASGGALSWSVATPDGPVASGVCEFLVVPTTGGELGVMADHAALVACVAPGALRVSQGAETRSIGVGHGIVEVRDNVVRLSVESAPAAGAEHPADTEHAAPPPAGGPAAGHPS
jgi:F0F1-type ATP synthase epsilon subunit